MSRLVGKIYALLHVQMLLFLLKSGLYVAERAEPRGELLRAVAFKSGWQLNCLWLCLHLSVDFVGGHPLLHLLAIRVFWRLLGV